MLIRLWFKALLLLAECADSGSMSWQLGSRSGQAPDSRAKRSKTTVLPNSLGS